MHLPLLSVPLLFAGVNVAPPLGDPLPVSPTPTLSVSASGEVYGPPAPGEMGSEWEALIGQLEGGSTESRTGLQEFFDTFNLGVIAVGTGALLGLIDSSTSKEWVEHTGDALQIVLPLAAIGATGVERDKEGAKQFTKSFLTQWAVVYTTKFSVEKWRPSASNSQSFPSGHTAAAFSGAAFINTRYGSKWGIPSYIGAAFTGWSRVNSQNHFMDDVLAGASIAWLSNAYWVTPQSSSVNVSPMISEQGYGVSVDLNAGGPSDPRSELQREESRKPKKWRYELALISSDTHKNDITVPAGTGTTVSLDEFDSFSNPLITAQGTLQYFQNPKDEWALRFIPVEIRDVGELGQDTLVDGTNFPQGTAVRSEYRYYDTRVRYRRELNPDGPLHFKIGADLSYQSLRYKLFDESGALHAEQRDDVILPLLHAHLGYELGKHWYAQVEADAMDLGTDQQLDVITQLLYQAGHHWDLSVGYRYYNRILETSKISNDFRMNQLLFGVGYAF